MGQLTCSVMLGFLALHIAVILMILSTATPEWLTSSHNDTGDRNATPFDNTTYPEITKGLWKICVGDNCTRVQQDQQESWFRAVQGLDVVGVGLGFVALCLTYSILLRDSCKSSGTAALFNTGTQLLAAANALTALIIFAVKAKKDISSDEFPLDYVVKYGWSYYVDIAAVVCMCVSAVLSLPSARHYATRRTGYENI